jgi:hypothetical protein
MKKDLIIIFITLLSFSNLKAQWNYLGLGDKLVNSLNLVDNFIIAGTKDGIYKKDLISQDTLWAPLGLIGKKVNTILIIDLEQMTDVKIGMSL